MAFPEGVWARRLFVVACWLGTRVLIAVAIFIVAPAHPVADLPVYEHLDGLDRLAHFDGRWYRTIVEHGYSFGPGGGEFSIAFFPGYPALVWLASRVGLPFTIAGALVNNAAFLAMLFVVEAWMRERCDAATGRWAVAMLCCAPQSLFGSTTYSEGTFMLLTALALRAFDRRRSGWAALWGALASATRLPGIALAPAFAIAALIERRGWRGWLAALAPLAGVCGFALFCALRFGDPLAFVHAQAGWRPYIGVDTVAWRNDFVAGIAGMQRFHLIAAVTLGFAWLTRRRLPLALTAVIAYFGVDAERQAWNGPEYAVLLCAAAAVAALAYRRELGAAATAFTLAGITMVVLAGILLSVDRLAYGIVTVCIALALVWRHFPALGFGVLAVLLIDLFHYAVTFGRGLWVA
jgi:MFS family permease